MSTLAVTAAPTRPIALVVVPDEPVEACKSWRRLVTGIDDRQRGAWALQGPWMNAGCVYEIPVHAVVLVVDQYADRWAVSMLRADAEGAVTPVHEWTLRNPMGKRVLNYVSRRLDADAAGHDAVPVDVEPNRFDSWCRVCRGPVPRLAGRIMRRNGRTAVTHHPGQCPPPPEVVRPNRYGGLCLLCGGWVPEGAGAAMRREVPRESGGQYDAVHDGCPADPLPGPPNQVPGWCEECGEMVAPAAGYWTERQLHHAGACPAPTVTGPTWIARLPRRGNFAVGTVRRFRIREQTTPVPVDAPGYRVLDAGWYELVGVVVETVTGSRGTRRARIRAATPQEAVDVLAVEVVLAADVRPSPSGFKARFCAEKIGHQKPWVAEIIGRDRQFGFRRRFLDPDRDYSGANSRGTRGVVYRWTLTVNRVYQAAIPRSWTRVERVWLRSTPEGDVVEIDEEEVLAWLDHAPVWPAI